MRDTQPAARFGDEINSVMERIDARSRQKDAPIRTGLDDLDTTNPFEYGEFAYTFGAFGAGCSTFALGVVRANTSHDLPALVVSWESSSELITTRLLAAEAEVPAHGIRNGLLRDEEWTRLAHALSKVNAWPLTIRPGPDTLPELAAVVQEWNESIEQPGIVVLDGLDMLARLSAPDVERQEPWEMHATVSAAIKHLAKRAGLLIVGTGHANREYRQRPDQRVRGYDAAYSHSYAADADIVVVIHRDDLIEPGSPRAGEADIYLTKSRNSEPGLCVAAFQGHYSRFVDLMASPDQ